MNLLLKNKNVLVLGGTRGIGRATAECFADEGANVALCARNADQVAAAVTDIEKKGVKVIGQSVDASDGAALRAWIESAAQDLGGIDILVSNAGAMALGSSVEAWEKNFRLDILAAVNAFEAAKPFLQSSAKEKGDAAVILVGSIAASEIQIGGAYGALKAALTNMNKSLANEYAGDHIRVNIVTPGMVDFEGGIWGQAKQNMPALYEQAYNSVRLGHPATPEHIADAIVFLSSPRSFSTTGANLVIDGAKSHKVTF